ncbi:MAG: enoyl-CoA hydratase/isomerase family protein [Acidobacteria bacterium]|nr:enoyl-CoA hydratase/isomerase family protein [Acidobacteriota bacterium]
MAVKEESPILFTREGKIARLVLNRPPLNILDLSTIAELNRRLTDLTADDSLHLLLLEGAGDRAFSAGVAVEDHVPAKLESMLASFHTVVRKIRDLPAITLAVVRGHCLGGGCELATACDLVLAAEEASFGLPEVELGCFPPVAAAFYPRRLGHARSLELLLTGRRFDGREALTLGLVSRTVPAANLTEAREDILRSLAGKSAAVARLIKKAVRRGQEHDFDCALEEAEKIYLDELAETEDMKEGLTAFLERRPPRWQDR